MRILILAAISLVPPLTAATVSLEDAMTKLYNFDFVATHAALNGYIAAHPAESLPYAFRASAYLFYELDRLGALESEFLVSDDELLAKHRLRPDPQVRAEFLRAVDDAQGRAEAALKTDPNNRAALFTMVVLGGTTTDYMALIEKRQMGSLAPARRTNSYAQRLLRLDPKCYDAYLTAGFSEYMIGSMPFFLRWFIHFDNVSGDKQRAVKDLELVAREGHYFKSLAKVFLAIIDLREKDPKAAHALLAELAREYPANPLYRKELAKIAEAMKSDAQAGTWLRP
jgi:hypothetical protein